MTSVPAQLLKVDDQVGSLKKGMLANFIVTSGKLFDEKTIIHQNWVQGEPYAIKIFGYQKTSVVITVLL
ncbi:MAG: hypothetical protein U5K54_01330 [Cytophagales bacterium]|nr:hypothetical protein [Cytophagales bacterium]